MRRDHYLVNDAGSWSVVAADAVDRIIADNREQDLPFVQAHEVALWMIEGDDYSVVRVVLDEPLTPIEEAEWIARARWCLETQGQPMLLCGGFDPDCLADWQDLDDVQGETDTVKPIAVPAGKYQVSLYTYLHSMNGAVWLNSSIVESPFPVLSEWFRRDHGDRALPSWAIPLLNHGNLPQEDPWMPIGEAVKSGKVTVDRDQLYWISYLVQILPWQDGMAVDSPDEEGWFDTRTGLRVPDRCPLGIATDCTEDTQVSTDLEWILET